MSESSFLSLVAEGLMPQPKRIRGMSIWDRHSLDAAFDKLTEERDSPKRKNMMDAIMGFDSND